MSDITSYPALELGQVLEDAAVVAVRTWRVQLVAWLAFALWTAAALAPAALSVTLTSARGLGVPLVVTAFIMTALWLLSLLGVSPRIAGFIAAATPAALAGEPPVRWPSRWRKVGAAGAIVGPLRALTSCGLIVPGIWVAALIGLMPAVMACEDRDATSGLRRAMQLSQGHRPLIATGVLTGLLALCGLELLALSLFWLFGNIFRGQSFSVIQLLFALFAFTAPVIAWVGFEGAVMAVIYHRVRARRDRAQLEDVFS